jgi:hypothetical protein
MLLGCLTECRWVDPIKGACDGDIGHARERRDKRTRGLVGKPTSKMSLRTPVIFGDDNTKMDLKEIVLEGMEWMNVANDSSRWRAFVNMIMKYHVP